MGALEQSSVDWFLDSRSLVIGVLWIPRGLGHESRVSILHHSGRLRDRIRETQIDFASSRFSDETYRGLVSSSPRSRSSRDEPPGEPFMLILDGATGTELDRRGVDVTLPLWSARAMIEAPEVLEEIHEDYLRAGADVIVTNTFRTHERSLARAGLPGQSGPLTRAAVEIAIRARNTIRPEAQVFGSVSPLEDCYCPERAPNRSACTEEHARMILDLVDAGVDHVLIETMSSARESLAAVEMARRHAPGRWSVSFCLDVENAPGHLIDGTPLSELLPELEGARHVGVNCVPAVNLIDHLQVIRDFLPDGATLAAYGNVGVPDDVRGWINTDAIDPERYASHVEDWLASGVELVGGCCGTSPQTILAIRDLRESGSHSPGT